MKNWILKQLQTNPEVQALNSHKDISGNSLVEIACLLAATFYKHKRQIVYVTNSIYNAQRLMERLVPLVGEQSCVLFGVEDSLRVEAIASSPENMAEKVATLAKLIEDPRRIVITNGAGLVRHLSNIDVFKECCIDLEVDMTIEMHELKNKLIQAGYTQVPHIDHPLSFSMRGGIIDVYSMNYDHPVRIEFFDNEIESLRFFDVASQSTIERIQNAKIIPASDMVLNDNQIQTIEKNALALLKERYSETLEENVLKDIEYLKSHLIEPNLYPYFSFLDDASSLIDYCDNPLIMMDDQEEIRRLNRNLIEDNIGYIREMAEEEKLLPKYAQFFDLHRVLGKHKVINVDPYGDNHSKIINIHLPKQRLEINLRLLAMNEKPVLCFLKDNEIEKVINTCVEINIPYHLGNEEPLQGINIVFDDLFEGFETEDFIVVTSLELFESKNQLSRYANKFKNAQVIQSYDELEPYDYIVHNQHGVGQYMGIETRQIMGVTKDFLRIVYRGNAELLVPLEQFRLVRKFVSSQGVVPKLNKLGSDEWTKTKNRLEENINDVASRLVELYALRKKNIGFKFPEDDDYQLEFEKGFEYELTPDQEKAVKEVKEDMQSDLPMDRLLCGDVGFGKTEVAIRAAFKAILANKQVAYLCPTTILASQHFKTFSDRFKDYPVEIRLLNRFVTPAEQTKTIQDVKEHKVDIIIGTHRILSKDVKFNDLGLLIIDEEQRFGVEQKEKIKELKNGIDVLSLSATPIPRSLQMSLVGIRSLSLLETPPNNRHTVQTYVVEKNDGLIKNAIEKELSRKGQVFYLYNNVEQIYGVARKIQSLVQGVRVQVVHGQMGREEIEDVMKNFMDKEIDVLVCTTIVETGIDIPNANTMIIDGAQNFGLSQLYQIKGRVGRSETIAYAYLMVPPKKQLSEIASKRLKAIKEFAKLGSGYKIALRDLTIRGAGDLLGDKQSGFIDTVGIDMYMEMLEEAINRQKGIITEEEKVVQKPNLAIDGYIPKEFVEEDYDKITMYQNIDKIKDNNSLNEYKEKVKDEYGRLPSSFDNLFNKKRLELLIVNNNVKEYRERKGQVEIIFNQIFSSNVDGLKLFQICNSISKDITLKYIHNEIYVILPKIKDPLPLAIEVIEKCQGALKNESR